MGNDKWLSRRVCRTCLRLFADGAFEPPPAPNSFDSGRKNIDGLRELHGSIEDVFSSALEGCIVCGIVAGSVREGQDCHRYLVSLVKSNGAMSEQSIDRHVMIHSMNESNKKRQQFDLEQQGESATNSLSDLDRLDLTLRRGSHYSFPTEWTEIDAQDHEPKTHFTLNLEPLNDDLFSRDVPIFKLTICIQTGLVKSEESLFIVQWTDLDEAGSASLDTTYTGGAESLNLTKSWLKHCEEAHSLCSDSGESIWYPTRLLKLEGTSARLLNCNSETPNGPYATLSHCWGKEDFITLSLSTLEALQNGLPIGSFPPVFSQAMAVVQNLGIDYLWIDSLCILQGSDQVARSDWEFESQRMNLVYANGKVNIGSSHASAPSEGCFAQRALKNRSYAVIEWAPAGRDTKRKFKVTLPDGMYPYLRHSDEDQPLMHRGWCIQERVLCRRMIIFHNDGVRWHCASCPEASEDRPTHHLIGYQPTEYQVVPGLLTGSNLAKSCIQNPVRYWNTLLSAFTYCDLTFPDQDKLRAIEGVAKRIEELFDDEYVLGHFWKQLPVSLCWHSFCSASLGQRLLPSWTWASLDGGLQFPYDHDGMGESKTYPMATLVFPESADGISPLSRRGCTLTFVGKLLPVHMIDLEAKEKAQDYTSRVGTSQWSVHAHFDIESERQKIWAKRSRFYLFPIFWWDKSSMSHSLLLVTKRSDGSCRRLGVADYWSRNPQEDWNDDEPAWVQEYRRSRPTLIMLS